MTPSDQRPVPDLGWGSSPLVVRMHAFGVTGGRGLAVTQASQPVQKNPSEAYYV